MEVAYHNQWGVHGVNGVAASTRVTVVMNELSLFDRTREGIATDSYLCERLSFFPALTLFDPKSVCLHIRTRLVNFILTDLFNHPWRNPTVSAVQRVHIIIH